MIIDNSEVTVNKGKKSYKCKIFDENICDQISNLKKHEVAIHEGKKLHKCNICNSIFEERQDNLHNKKIRGSTWVLFMKERNHTSVTFVIQFLKKHRADVHKGNKS